MIKKYFKLFLLNVFIFFCSFCQAYTQAQRFKQASAVAKAAELKVHKESSHCYLGLRC
jgi:hypothetical protein